MSSETFVGFGLGPIQVGLFLAEAARSGKFSRLVVAEVVPEIVADVRAGGGVLRVNIATATGIEVRELRGVDVYNPRVAEDRDRLVAAVAEAREIATALPGVAWYETGGPETVAGILAEGVLRKPADRRAVVYTAENHTQAAELLATAVRARLGARARILKERMLFLNTVIGKMSGVVTEPDRMRAGGLTPMVPHGERAVLVEEFNRILISKILWPDFPRGLAVFEERDDLRPFAEAKLYGHNAIHALLGFLGHRRWYRWMAQVAADADLMALARGAFLEESGVALCRRHAGRDPLFTAEGFREYADDLLRRMTNPYLEDAIARVIRDPRRKLAWNDRLIGAMRLAMEYGVQPTRLALGAAAALRTLAEIEGSTVTALLPTLWREDAPDVAERSRVLALLHAADERLGAGG